MLADLRALVTDFPAGTKVRLAFYLVAQFAAAVMDLLGVAVVLPILQVLSGAPLDTGVVGWVHELLGEPGRQRFVVLLCIVMVLAFVVKAALSMALHWWSLGFIARLQASTQARLMRHYLQMDYLEYRRRNTGELIRTVGSAVADAHGRVLAGVLSVITWSVQALLLLGFLLVTVPVPALVAAVYLGAVVLLLQRGLAPLNRRVGEQAQKVEWDRSVAVVEAFRGLRDLRLHNAQELTVARFDEINRRGAGVIRSSGFLGSMPRQLLELATIVGLAVLLLAVALSTGSEGSDVAVLGIFVAATLKLLPAVTSITASLGMIRQGEEGLRITVEALRGISEVRSEDPPLIPDSSAAPQLLEVAAVSFRYPDAPENVLSGVSFQVPAGTSLAICGASGSGKTTLGDIILGLITPTQGAVRYGGRPVAESRVDWYDTIAHVPQDVYLHDASVMENVAFGVPPGQIDRVRVERCLAAVQLDDVVASLPDGADSAIGERGMRLSGGQRQRIGIARALYRQPSVMLLDEATSALDNSTEREITDTIAALAGDVTTIVIAHRLSTVKHVDRLLFMEGGRIMADGTFQEVCAASPAFARLVELGSLDFRPEGEADYARD